MNRGFILVFSGPSGVGKGTILQRVLEQDNNLAYSVSCTTRSPREGETDGVHYHFISKQEFSDNIKNGKMLEYTSYCDNYYGTSAEYVDKLLDAGRDVVLEIETQGAENVMRLRCDDTISVFVAPPSFEQLKKRLEGRGTEPADVIARRVEKAREELMKIDNYDYLVINDDLNSAVEDVKAILRAERIKKNKTNYKF